MLPTTRHKLTLKMQKSNSSVIYHLSPWPRDAPCAQLPPTCNITKFHIGGAVSLICHQRWVTTFHERPTGMRDVHPESGPSPYTQRGLAGADPCSQTTFNPWEDLDPGLPEIPEGSCYLSKSCAIKRPHLVLISGLPSHFIFTQKPCSPLL